MRFNTFVSSLTDLSRCADADGVEEVLIEPELLAREGRISTDASTGLAQAASARGLRPVLVWDILMTDEEFAGCADTVLHIGPSFKAIRVQCIGAARFVKERLPGMPIQLIAETANCNLRTLMLWCSLLGPRLERIILSIQLPAKKIAEFITALPVECEILALGRILLFYSRRNLLRRHFGDLGETWREVIAASEDSHNRPFPIIDNSHGTFMYLDKDQFILHRLSELGGVLPAVLRLDLRHLSEFPESSFDIERIAAGARNSPEALRESWPRPTIAPFFKSNLTTKQFKFLNSDLRFSRDERCAAEVVSTERERHTVLRVVEPFTLPAAFRAIDPNGTETVYEIHAVKTLSGDAVTSTVADQIVLAPWMRKVSTGSLLVREEAVRAEDAPSSA